MTWVFVFINVNVVNNYACVIICRCCYNNLWIYLLALLGIVFADIVAMKKLSIEKLNTDNSKYKLKYTKEGFRSKFYLAITVLRYKII